MGKGNDKSQRTRVSRHGVWQNSFANNPCGRGTIKLPNLPNRVLAAIEVTGEKNGLSVQEIVRRHLNEIYSEQSDNAKNT